MNLPTYTLPGGDVVLCKPDGDPLHYMSRAQAEAAAAKRGAELGVVLTVRQPGRGRCWYLAVPAPVQP